MSQKQSKKMNKEKLQTLEEFNQEQLKRYFKDKHPVKKNGIACPECGEELMDTNPSFRLLSYPPQTSVHCICGYKGHRIY